ncbi:MAG: response regulator [Rhodobacteraceae bacterium]|nr:response regulator [Paracoccaceae bacterium]
MGEATTTITERLARERRLRLAAERLLEQKSRELFAANQQLAIHARALSVQIVEQRQVVASALSEAEALKGQNSRVLSELEKAHAAAVMAERRLLDSLDTIQDGFAIFDAEGRLVTANGAFLALFAGTGEVAPGIAYPRLLAIAAERGIVELEGAAAPDWVGAMAARWDEEPIPARVLRLAAGRFLRLIDRRGRGGDTVSMALDITETIARERELDEARARAEAASRAKSAFLANMSHEIRTPMNGVVGMAELLCDGSLSEEQRLYAETIRSSGEALLHIINDILDYSKIEAERLVLHPEPVDLERLVHEIAVLLMPRATARGIDLTIDYDMFLPTRFVADPGRLRQVLVNLAGNAVKFTEAGHVLLRVVGFDTGAGGWQLHVTVEDTGIGIAPEHLDHIFGEFNQVEAEANRKYEGTGLGLAITRQLVTLMGGEIWVESVPGEGSCFGFRLTLPAAEPAGEIAPAPAGFRRALVVDDQLVNRTILERQLSAYGLEVTLCRSGAEALRALDAGAPPDVVLTDHAMPEMDGIELAAALRARGVTAPVLLVSSNPAAVPGEAARNLLAAVLQKPLLRRDLYRRLAALAPEPPPAPAPVESALRRAMRVLAAEDNRTNQLVFQKMVKDLDIELAFASNGREAVDLVDRFHPDMIFMDISMPEMDGREATRTIRAAEAARGAGRVPIVALTAHAMEGDREAILAAGLDHYLTKPLRKTAIVERILALRPAGTRPPQAAGPA